MSWVDILRCCCACLHHHKFTSTVTALSGSSDYFFFTCIKSIILFVRRYHKKRVWIYQADRSACPGNWQVYIDRVYRRSVFINKERDSSLNRLPNRINQEWRHYGFEMEREMLCWNWGRPQYFNDARCSARSHDRSRPYMFFFK